MRGDIDVLWVLDIIGISVFAASGALLALERGFDLVGLLALGTVTALGGGVLRDLIVHQGVPVAFDSPTPFITAALAALITVGLNGILRRWRRTFLTFDAVGLALFSVTGAAIALDAGLLAIPATLVGVMTATGGGIIRDVLAGQPPQIFRADSTLYAIPAALGAGILVAGSRLGLADSPAALLGAGVVLVVRLGALQFGWRAPVPTYKRR